MMERKNTILVLVLLLLFFNNTVYSQREKKTSGEYTVTIEDHMSFNDAKWSARDLAIVNAIENAFGSLVEQETNMAIENRVSNFRIYAGIKVKGDWIETTDGPDWFENIAKDGSGKRSVTCKIKGIARELLPGPLIKCKALKCPALECENLQFKPLEKMFIYFESPIDGYVSVFVEQDDSTQRLLPYHSIEGEYSNCMPVKENRPYYFFDLNDDEQPGVTNIVMDTENMEREEINTIHVIFSSKFFFKPGLDPVRDRKDGLKVPASLSNEEFNEWLVKNRRGSSSFQDIPIRVTILPRK